MIGFVGSVFSPYYAWAGRRDPLDHVALHAALYSLDGRRGRSAWALTERGRRAVNRTRDLLRVGPSAMWRDGDLIQVEVDERSWPLPTRVRGRVRLWPEVRAGQEHLLSAAGNHRWCPIAPRARVEVAFEEPAVRWVGTGYFDANRGAEPLEAAFHDWTWSRAPLGRGAAVIYDLRPRRGPAKGLALRFDAGGAVQAIEAPPVVGLPTTRFRLARATRSEAGAALVGTLTDSHFYARSVVRSRLQGEWTTGVHESLSLDRFGTRWAKALLPFRAPRWAR